jgi:hypothetical protein
VTDRVTHKILSNVRERTGRALSRKGFSMPESRKTKAPPMSRRASTRKQAGKILDLFAGAGGWAEGLRMLGLNALGIETDPWACAPHTPQATSAYRPT